MWHNAFCQSEIAIRQISFNSELSKFSKNSIQILADKLGL